MFLITQQNLFILFNFRIIPFEPFFFYLGNTPNTKKILPLVFALDITFLFVSLATSLYTTSFYSNDIKETETLNLLLQYISSLISDLFICYQG